MTREIKVSMIQKKFASVLTSPPPPPPPPAHAFYCLTSNGERRHIIETLMMDLLRNNKLSYCLVWFGIIETVMMDLLQKGNKHQSNFILQ